ncbi:MAG: hypothetical protein Kow0092_27430 [Deferrisomatales bacterium]
MDGVRVRGVVALLFALMWTVGCTGGARTARTPSRQAPDFTLASVDGREVSLSDFAGKVVLIHFWATWCPPCRAAIPHEMELQETYGDEGFVVLGLSLDKDPEELREFLDRRPVNYPMLLVDEATRQAYGGVPTVPLTVVIDRQGRIRKKLLGFSFETAETIERTVRNLLREQEPLRVAGS